MIPLNPITVNKKNKLNNKVSSTSISSTTSSSTSSTSTSRSRLRSLHYSKLVPYHAGAPLRPGGVIHHSIKRLSSVYQHPSDTNEFINHIPLLSTTSTTTTTTCTNTNIVPSSSDSVITSGNDSVSIINMTATNSYHQNNNNIMDEYICQWELGVCCHQWKDPSPILRRIPRLCHKSFQSYTALLNHLMEHHVDTNVSNRCGHCHWRGCVRIFRNNSRFSRRDHFKHHCQQQDDSIHHTNIMSGDDNNTIHSDYLSSPMVSSLSSSHNSHHIHPLFGSSPLRPSTIENWIQNDSLKAIHSPPPPSLQHSISLPSVPGPSSESVRDISHFRDKIPLSRIDPGIELTGTEIILSSANSSTQHNNDISNMSLIKSSSFLDTYRTHTNNINSLQHQQMITDHTIIQSIPSVLDEIKTTLHTMTTTQMERLTGMENTVLGNRSEPNSTTIISQAVEGDEYYNLNSKPDIFSSQSHHNLLTISPPWPTIHPTTSPTQSLSLSPTSVSPPSNNESNNTITDTIMNQMTSHYQTLSNRLDHLESIIASRQHEHISVTQFVNEQMKSMENRLLNSIMNLLLPIEIKQEGHTLKNSKELSPIVQPVDKITMDKSTCCNGTTLSSSSFMVDDSIESIVRDQHFNSTCIDTILINNGDNSVTTTQKENVSSLSRLDNTVHLHGVDSAIHLDSGIQVSSIELGTSNNSLSSDVVNPVLVNSEMISSPVNIDSMNKDQDDEEQQGVVDSGIITNNNNTDMTVELDDNHYNLTHQVINQMNSSIEMDDSINDNNICRKLSWYEPNKFIVPIQIIPIISTSSSTTTTSVPVTPINTTPIIEDSLMRSNNHIIIDNNNDHDDTTSKTIPKTIISSVNMITKSPTSSTQPPPPSVTPISTRLTPSSSSSSSPSLVPSYDDLPEPHHPTSTSSGSIHQQDKLVPSADLNEGIPEMIVNKKDKKKQRKRSTTTIKVWKVVTGVFRWPLRHNIRE